MQCADLLTHLRDERPDLLDVVRLALWVAYPSALSVAQRSLPPSSQDAERIIALLEDLVDVAGTWRHPAQVNSTHYRNEADVPDLLRLVGLELERPTVTGARRLRLRQIRDRLETVRDHRCAQARRRRS